MRGRSWGRLAAVAVLAYLVVSAVPVAAANTNLAAGSMHTTASDFQAATTLDNTTVSGSGTAAYVELTEAGTRDVVDDFESFDGSNYQGNLSQFSQDNTHVKHGSWALQGTTSGNSHQIISTSGLAAYPSAGDSFQYWVYTGEANFAFMQFGVQDADSHYAAIIGAAGSQVILRKTDNGATTDLDSQTAADIQPNTWLQVRVDWGASGDINVSVLNESGGAVTSVNATDSTFTSGGVGFQVNTPGTESGVSAWFDYVRTLGPVDRGVYVSQNHTVSNATQARVNTTLDNATAVLTALKHDGSGFVEVSSTTVSSSGNHTIDISGHEDATTWRINVTFRAQSGDTTARLHDEMIQFTNAQPRIDNSSATPSGGAAAATIPVELNISVSDRTFGRPQGESLTVEFFIDGSSVGTDTLSANGTASLTTSATGGDHQWSVNVSDAHGGTTPSAAFSFTVPNELQVRNETAPSELVDNVTVEIRAFANETGTVQVIERNTSDGTINMTGFPADQPFIVVAQANGYHDRRIFVRSLSETQTIYLLPSSEPVADTIFRIDDYTGNFPTDTTVLLVQRALNGSYRTVLGDFFGATGEFPAELADGQRHRLVLFNAETGEQRIAGTYTPLTASTQTVVVTPQGVAAVEGAPPSVVLQPQARRLPALDGAEIAATVHENDLDVTGWRATATLVNNTTSTRVWTATSNGPGTQNTALNLNSSHEATLVVNVTWNASNGLSATETFEISLSRTFTNDATLLDSVDRLEQQSPAGRARAAFTTFVAMLVTVFVVAATGSIQPSSEIAGFAGVLTLTAFAVVGFGVGYDLVFAASVGLVSFVAIRRV